MFYTDTTHSATFLMTWPANIFDQRIKVSAGTGRLRMDDDGRVKAAKNRNPGIAPYPPLIMACMGFFKVFGVFIRGRFRSGRRGAER